MKSFLKKVLKVGIVLFLLAVAALGVVWLQAEHYGPWATGGPNRAMLGATFGMSVPEVERATKQRLMRCWEADDVIHDFDGKLPFDVKVHCEAEWQVDREAWTRSEYRFINTIDLFGVPCWLMLTFFDGRLEHVQAHFQPYADVAKVVETVHTQLQRSGYTFEKREESKEAPGAYRNTYRRKPVEATFWVNLTDPKKPSISLYVSDNDMAEARKHEKAERDKSAL